MAAFHRTCFQIASEDSQGIDLMTQVGGVVRGWAEGALDLPFGDEASGEWRRNGHVARVEREASNVDGWGCWALTLERLADDEEAQGWSVEFLAATKGDGVDADILAIGESDDDISLAAAANLPALLTPLAAGFRCASHEGSRLSAAAVRVAPGDAEAFAKSELLARSRREPLVVLSENPIGGAFASPDYLQSILFGLARVVALDSETARAMSLELGESLECPGGALRVYSPGCAAEDPAWRNPLWTWQDMTDMLPSQGWRGIVREIEDGCKRYALPQTGRSVYYQVRDRIRQARHEAMEERLERLEQLEREYSERAKKAEEEARASAPDDEMLEELVDDLAEKERKLSESEQEKQALLEKVAELEETNEQLNLALAYSGADGANSETAYEEPSEFSSVIEVVEYAKRKLPTVRFLESAVATARASHFPRPNDGRRALDALDDCAAERVKGPLGRDIQQWFAERGFNYTPRESETTMGIYGDQRRFWDEATKRPVEMQPHLRLGGGSGEHNQLWMHVVWSEDEGKWLVGHMGRHLQTVTG